MDGLEQPIKDLEQKNNELEVEIAIFQKEHAHSKLRPLVKFRFIHEHSTQFPIDKMCSVLGVSRSGYYKWKNAMPSDSELRRIMWTERIVYHFQNNDGNFGSRKITLLLKQEGIEVSERTVARIMSDHNLSSLTMNK